MNFDREPQGLKNFPLHRQVNKTNKGELTQLMSKLNCFQKAVSNISKLPIKDNITSLWTLLEINLIEESCYRTKSLTTSYLNKSILTQDEANMIINQIYDIYSKSIDNKYKRKMITGEQASMEIDRLKNHIY